MIMQTRWVPFTEPWRATARRTGTIAVAVGVGVGLYKRQRSAVPLTTLLALWVTLGGHVVEVLFRDRLRYRVDSRAAAPAIARLVYWFAGGSALYAGASATRALLTGQGPLERHPEVMIVGSEKWFVDFRWCG